MSAAVVIHCPHCGKLLGERTVWIKGVRYHFGCVVCSAPDGCDRHDDDPVEQLSQQHGSASAGPEMEGGGTNYTPPHTEE